MVMHSGLVWCPTTTNGTWLARRNGTVYFTGNSQVEVVVPNVRSISLVKSLDADADTATIVIDNTLFGNPVTQDANDLGAPGYFTPQRGQDVINRWGHILGPWTGVLGRNALIRTYEGYGGYGLTLGGALAAGNLVKTGTWLVDDPQIATNGQMTLVCRSMAKLLVDQQVYPPLIPPSIYPLQYSRFWYREAYNPQILYGTSDAEIPQKDVMDMTLTSTGDGYWIVGNDGGVFSFGNTFFHGSLGGRAIWFTHPTIPPFQARVVGIARSPDDPEAPPDVILNPGEGDEILVASGYWLALNTGDVVAFGDAALPENTFSPTGANLFLECIGIMRAGNLNGYWLVQSTGAVYAFGAAGYHGGGSGLITAFASTPTGQGYWLANGLGQVSSFGDAAYHGGITVPLAGAIVGMDSTPTGLGYYLVGSDGGVFAFGDAVYQGSIPGLVPPVVLADPMVGINVKPDGTGYWLVAKDGGVFAFNVPFHGSMPGQFIEEEPFDGNYKDFTDIIKDFALWCGFNLYDGVNANVYGNMETTGIYSTSILDATVFDKAPVIDGLKKIRDVVNFELYVDDDGALRFQEPNWWESGNNLPDGTRLTGALPVIDEKVQLTVYNLSQPDTNLLSAITVASEDPELTIPGTVFSTVTPPGAEDLKGMIKPALYVNEIFVLQTDVDTMAALLAIRLPQKAHLGSITCLANPIFEVDDQVQIVERQSAEVGAHWIRGITSTHDLKTGSYTMQLVTNYLSATTGDWIVTKPAGSPDGAVVVFRHE